MLPRELLHNRLATSSVLKYESHVSVIVTVLLV